MYYDFLDEQELDSSVEKSEKKYRDILEVIHIPPKFQQIKHGLNLPVAAASVIGRYSSSMATPTADTSQNVPQTTASQPSKSIDKKQT